jgi:very-short-patch-repair endonuclease
MQLTTCEDLWRTWGDLVSRGRRGVRLLRALLFDRQPGYVAPASELEAMFRELVRKAGLAEPERQINLGDEAWVGRVDFYFRRYRLIVEVDGKLGHTSKLDVESDQRRDEDFGRAGWRVRRFTWEDLVTRPHWVVAELRNEMSLAA